MSADDSYRTIEAPCEHEPDKTKGSRHIGNAFPVHDHDEIAAALASVRARMPDATHHAWAWRLGRGDQDFRYSDDGEPSGSAGRPILQQLEGAEVVDAAVVVVRWFGGTKLGVGGLVRAYGAAAREVLEQAPKRRVEVTERLELDFAYELAGAVQA